MSVTGTPTSVALMGIAETSGALTVADANWATFKTQIQNLMESA